MGEPKGFHGSWNGIMKSMLDSFAELCPEAEIKFNTEVLAVNIGAGTLKTEEDYDFILECDEVGSIVLLNLQFRYLEKGEVVVD